MIKLKERECLENRIETFNDVPFHIYIALVDKYRGGEKIDGSSIVLCQDCGFPTNPKNLTLITGNIITLCSLIKNGHIPFDVTDYDASDFKNSYLQKLIPMSPVKDKYKYPKDYLDWEYDIEGFNYSKTLTLNESNLEDKNKLIYDISTPNREPKRIHLPLSLCKITPKINPKKDTVVIKIPPKLLQDAPKSVVKLAEPSNMWIIVRD